MAVAGRKSRLGKRGSVLCDCRRLLVLLLMYSLRFLHALVGLQLVGVLPLAGAPELVFPVLVFTVLFSQTMFTDSF
jgi:hypothetical protein